MATQLHNIRVPEMGADFGSQMQEQFEHINNNFKKLAASRLFSGADGTSAQYVVYNFNAITLWANRLAGTFAVKQQLSKRTESKSDSVITHALRLEDEIKKDYQDYFAKTGRSEEAYVRECYRLYFGIIDSKTNAIDSIEFAFDDGGTKKPILIDGYIRYDGKKIPQPADTIPNNFASSIAGAIYKHYMCDMDQEGLLTPLPYYTSTTETQVESGKLYAVWMLDWAMAEDTQTAIKIFEDNILKNDPGKLTVAVTKVDSDVDMLVPVGSLPYLHVDHRFRNGYLSQVQHYPEDVQNEYAAVHDISCVLYGEPVQGASELYTGMTFKVANPFPQIRFDKSKQAYYWNINGIETDIPVSGEKGEPGKSSQFVIVERLENLHYYRVNGDVHNIDIEWPETLALGYNYSTWTGPKPIATLGETRYNESASRESIADSTRYFPLYNPEEWLGQDFKENPRDPNLTYRVFGIAGGDVFWEVPTQDMINTYGLKPIKPTQDIIDLADSAETKTINGVECVPIRGFEGIYLKQTGSGSDKTIDTSRFYDADLNEIYDIVPIPSSGVGSNAALYDRLLELDGVPCVVVPGGAYQREHFQTTYWFSRLTLHKYENKTSDSSSTNQAFLTVYCGPENMFDTRVDEHSFAGMMEGLDVYEHRYNRHNANHNKPRGYMLPIGSRFIDSNVLETNADNIAKEYAAHILYSDLGGFESNTEGGFKRYAPDALKNVVQGPTVTNGEQTTEFKGVWGKHVMHIGSIQDYRVFNDANLGAPAIPGMPTRPGADHTGIFASNRYDDMKVLGQHYITSELHIDEPVTITHYRDTYLRNKDLLTVEGNVVIGPKDHANTQNMNMNLGGLHVPGILQGAYDETGNKCKEQGRKAYGQNGGVPTISDKPEILTQLLNYFSYTHQYQFNTATGQYAWNAGSAEIDFWSALFDYGLGAKFLTSYEGIAVGGNSPQGSAFQPKFSVDRNGNIEFDGEEIINHRNARWNFHHEWKRGDKTHHNTLYMGLSFNDVPTAGSSGNIWGTSTRLKDSTHTHTSNFGYHKDNGSGVVRYRGLINDINESPEVFDGTQARTVINLWTDSLRALGSINIAGISPWSVSDTHTLHYGFTVKNAAYIDGAALSNPTNMSSGISMYDLTNHLPGDLKPTYVKNTQINIPRQNKWWTLRQIDTIPSSQYGPHWSNFAISGFGNYNPSWNNTVGLITKNGIYSKGDVYTDGQLGVRSHITTGGSAYIYGVLDVIGSSYIGKDQIIGGRLYVANRAVIKEDVAAKAFFRENSTHGQILMADGRSTRGWEDQHSTGGNLAGAQIDPPYMAQNFADFKNPDGIKSPLIIDYGTVYRQARLGKFDLVRDVQLVNDSGSIKITRTNPADNNDNQFAFFCQMPAESLRIQNKFRFFDKHSYANSDSKTGKIFNEVNVNAFCNGCIAYVHMSFPLDYYSKSGDRNKKGPFGGGRYNHAYGIKMTARADGEKVSSSNHDTWFKSTKCDGFKWDDVMKYETIIGENAVITHFPKPKHSVQAFVPSLYENDRWAHGAAANWRDSGTDAERSRQYGVIFELTPAGDLLIKDCNAPEALSHWNRIVTRDMWFVYEYEPKGYETYVVFYSGGNGETTTPTKTTNPNITIDGVSVFTSTSKVDSNIDNGKYLNKCVWIKNLASETELSSTDTKWKSLEWSLYYDGTINNQDSSNENIVYKFGRIESCNPSDATRGSEIQDFSGSYQPIVGPSIGATEVKLAAGDENNIVNSIFGTNAINSHQLKDSGPDNNWPITNEIYTNNCLPIKKFVSDESGEWREDSTQELKNLADVLNAYVEFIGIQSTSPTLNIYKTRLEQIMNIYLADKGSSAIVVSTGWKEGEVTVIKHILLYPDSAGSVAKKTVAPLFCWDVSNGDLNSSNPRYITDISSQKSDKLNGSTKYHFNPNGFAASGSATDLKGSQTQLQNLNKMTIKSVVSNEIVFININIPLDAKFWSGDRKNNNDQRLLTYGINLCPDYWTSNNWDGGHVIACANNAGDIIRNSHLGRTFKCDGFKWNEIGVQPPQNAIDYVVTSTMSPSSYFECNSGSKIRWWGGDSKPPKFETGYEQLTMNRYGCTFRLDKDGLWLTQCYYPEALVPNAGNSINIQFSYPINFITRQITPPNIEYTWCYSSTPPSTVAGGGIPVVTGSTGTVTDPSSIDTSELNSSNKRYIYIKPTNQSNWMLYAEYVDPTMRYGVADGLGSDDISNIELLTGDQYTTIKDAVESDGGIDSVAIETFMAVNYPTKTRVVSCNKYVDEENGETLTDFDWDVVYEREPSAEVVVAAGIASPVVNVSATYGSLNIHSDAYWSVFPITDRNDVVPTVSNTAITASDITANSAPCPGSYSDDDPTKVGGYVLQDKNDTSKYYMISLERWGKVNNTWTCILSTDNVLTDLWAQIKSSCKAQNFSWETLIDCYGSGTPVSPITINFANGIFVIQDIHIDSDVKDDDPTLTMYGFLRIFASQFKPLAGSHGFMKCYEVNTGIHFVCPKNATNRSLAYAGAGNNNNRTMLQGTVNLLGSPS